MTNIFSIKRKQLTISDITVIKWRGRIPLIGLTPPHLCAYLKSI